MDCRKFSRSLNAYFGKELSEEQVKEVNKHMESCENCRKVYKQERQSYKELLSFEHMDASSFKSSRNDILNSIDKNRYGASTSKKMGFFFKKNFSRIATTAVTAAAVLVISVYSIGYFRNMNSKSSIVETPNKEYTVPSSNNKQNITPDVKTPVDNTTKDNNTQLSNDSMYTNEKLGFSLTFPGNWNEKYTIKEDENGLRVYFKPEDVSMQNTAFLFCIFKKSYAPAENTDTVGQPRNFTAKGVVYIIGGPTDVGFPPDHKEFNQYFKMHNEIKEVLKTLKILNTSKNVTETFNVEQLFGEWTITRVVASTPVGTYSQQDINKIIGRKMTFAKDKASSLGDSLEYLDVTADNPIYGWKVVKKDDFLTDWKISLDKLGISAESVLEIDVTGKTQGACILFYKDAKTLLVFGGGNFFELKKE